MSQRHIRQPNLVSISVFHDPFNGLDQMASRSISIRPYDLDVDELHLRSNTGSYSPPSRPTDNPGYRGSMPILINVSQSLNGLPTCEIHCGSNSSFDPQVRMVSDSGVKNCYNNTRAIRA